MTTTFYFLSAVLVFFAFMFVDDRTAAWIQEKLEEIQKNIDNKL